MILFQIKNPLERETILIHDTWDKILFKHPEMKGYLYEIEETILFPEFIAESVYDYRVLLYYRFYPNILNGKYLTVVVKSIDFDFISTAYFTHQPIKGGTVVWRRMI